MTRHLIPHVLVLLLLARSYQAFAPLGAGARPRCDGGPPAAAQARRAATADGTAATDGTGAAPPGDVRLEPFLPAVDPDYINVGPVGGGRFLVAREGGPRPEELTNENLLLIVQNDGCTDLEVNTLVWRALGYRFDGGAWRSAGVFPKWREKFPTPPDLIGMRRVYSREVDEPSLRANQQLVRSIPYRHKQQLRQHLRPLGFNGFKIAELTPNKTRRAQCANWLLYYREHLFGYTVEELRARREREATGEPPEPEEETWRPPVKEVF